MGLLDKIKASVVGAGIKTTGSIFKDLADGIAQFVNTPEAKEKALEFIKTKEAEAQAESDRHEEVVAKTAQDEYAAMLADSKSARDMNTSLQGTQPSWLAKNVAYCIDIFIMLIWGSITCYLLARMLNFISKDDHVDLTAVLAVWGGITAMATTVINFHRGSTQSSKQKDDVIQKIAQTP